ncbi:MAG: HAD family hydrolase [Gemmatimonadales bacterium]
MPTDHLSTRRPAVFFDRDGTLIDDVGYLNDPAQVRLLDGAVEAVAHVNAAGFLAIIATNQSGIARGIISPEEYRAVEARTAELLSAGGGRIDAQFFCPHAPEIGDPCDCRKPGVKLYRDADARFGIDFARSVWIGDRLRDVQPARTLGGIGILVRTGQGELDASAALADGFKVVVDVGTAVRSVISDRSA